MADKISYAEALKKSSTSSGKSSSQASPTRAQSSSMASPTRAQSSSMASPTRAQSSSMASPMPAQSSSVTSPTPAQSSSVASPKAVHKDCMYHSRKWMHSFQYMVNNLYSEKLIAGPKKIEFSRKICFCDEQFDFTSLFTNRAQANDYVNFTRTAISKWKKAPHTVKQLLELFGKFEKGEEISAGFLKFLYYFRKSYDGEFKPTEN